MTNKITLLSQETIDQIAAGEVVERPASIVKELVENAIDAGANAITVEIKEGGMKLIRITDNGSGIPKDQVQIAFLRHATSKIKTVEDLLTAGTLGFRGEALSSIAAVCQVELITKTAGALTGVRYVIEGGAEKSMDEIGAPEGTTFLVHNMFFNTPARKKFLKSATTEGGYISDLMERMAISHPGISFKFIQNNAVKLHTSGNCNLKDIVYGIYGREIAANLLKIDAENEMIRVTGFIGKPVISRGNRNYENYFVNGRYVKSNIISKAIEEAYKPFMMNHRYPFTAISIEINTDQVDVNVHPTKMEVRFARQMELYDHMFAIVKETLAGKDLIPEIQSEPDVIKKERHEEPPSKPFLQPEPFEKLRAKLIAEADSPYERKYPQRSGVLKPVTGSVPGNVFNNAPVNAPGSSSVKKEQLPKQMELFESGLLDAKNRSRHKLIGQIFDTYWLVEFEEKLFIIDQHAAHEKVMYERLMKKLRTKEQTSQMIAPPIIVSLRQNEAVLLEEHINEFRSVGFEIEHFGGNEYSIRAVPGNLYGLADRTLFIEILDGLSDVSEKASEDSICEKIASMSCKAAVKGNSRMSTMEADTLIDELLTLENPYNCPHGRPTIISMSKYELEKKFKRVL